MYIDSHVGLWNIGKTYRALEAFQALIHYLTEYLVSRVVDSQSISFREI